MMYQQFQTTLKMDTHPKPTTTITPMITPQIPFCTLPTTSTIIIFTTKHPTTVKTTTTPRTTITVLVTMPPTTTLTTNKTVLFYLDLARTATIVNYCIFALAIFSCFACTIIPYQCYDDFLIFHSMSVLRYQNIIHTYLMPFYFCSLSAFPLNMGVIY